MIPALLSCFYVAYLYHTLNSERISDKLPAEQSDRSIDARLEELSQRIENLAKRIEQGGKK